MQMSRAEAPAPVARSARAGAAAFSTMSSSTAAAGGGGAAAARVGATGAAAAATNGALAELRLEPFAAVPSVDLGSAAPSGCAVAWLRAVSSEASASLALQKVEALREL